MVTLEERAVRRLALARAGLLAPERAGFPCGCGRGEAQARRAALGVIERFGYLQLDTVSVAGARTHGIVLLSRLPGFEPALAEVLLAPGEPLFEYWGHEASWIPLSLYPLFRWRREQFRQHPWWGDILTEHEALAAEVLRRVEAEGPLTSRQLGNGAQRPRGGFWQLSAIKRVLAALWSSGELAIRQRSGFQRCYDRVERVIPAELRERRVSDEEAFAALLLKALEGHGWASASTLARTFRLKPKRHPVAATLQRLVDEGSIVPCELVRAHGRRSSGFVRPEDLELAAALSRLRPRGDRGVLLSPFDPLLWDRQRVAELFGFEQILEIYKPAAQRVYGYYCLPVLAGERLVARVDLKACRPMLRVLSMHLEDAPWIEPRAQGAAVASALERYAGDLGLELG